MAPYKNDEISVVKRANKLIGRKFCLNFFMLTLLAPAKSIKQSTPSIRYSSNPNSPKLSINALSDSNGAKFLSSNSPNDMISEKKISAISLCKIRLLVPLVPEK